MQQPYAYPPPQPAPRRGYGPLLWILGILFGCVLIACVGGGAVVVFVAARPKPTPVPTPTGLGISAAATAMRARGLSFELVGPAIGRFDLASQPSKSGSLYPANSPVFATPLLDLYEYTSDADAQAFARGTSASYTRYAHRNIGLACTKGREAECQPYLAAIKDAFP